MNRQGQSEKSLTGVTNAIQYFYNLVVGTLVADTILVDLIEADNISTETIEGQTAQFHDATIDGTLDVNYLTVDDVLVYNDLTVEHDVLIEENLTVHGNTSLNTLITNGLATLESLLVNTTAIVTGNTSLSTLETSGLATLDSLLVETTATVTGNTSLSTLETSGLATLDSLLVETTATVTGNTSLSTLETSGLATLNSLYVNTTSDFIGLATFEDIDINGELTLTDLSLTDLEVTNQTTLNILDVSGQSTLTDLEVTNQTTLNILDVSGQSTLTDLEVTNQATLNILDVSGQSTLTDLEVTNQTTLNILDVSGQSTLTDLEVTNQSTLNSLNVVGQSILGDLEVLNVGIGYDNQPADAISLVPGGGSTANDYSYTNPTTGWAQQFILSQAGTVDSININLYRNGTSLNTFTVSIQSGTDFPTAIVATLVSNVLWSSIVLNTSGIQSSSSYSVPISSTVNLNAGVSYWLVVRNDFWGSTCKWAQSGGSSTGYKVANRDALAWSYYGNTYNLGCEIRLTNLGSLSVLGETRMLGSGSVFRNRSNVTLIPGIIFINGATDNDFYPCWASQARVNPDNAMDRVIVAPFYKVECYQNFSYGGTLLDTFTNLTNEAVLYTISSANVISSAKVFILEEDNTTWTELTITGIS